MKIINIDLKENGKKYFCKQANEVFKVEEGNLIASTRSFSMAELLKMDFEEIKEMKNPYERVDSRDIYYVVNVHGVIGSFKDVNDLTDKGHFNNLNYFNNKNYAEYVAFKETLMRKIDRFAWENNAKVVGWDDWSNKHFITFNSSLLTLNVSCCMVCMSNVIYFTSKEIAEKAIEEFKDDLIKLYTWRFDV